VWPKPPGRRPYGGPRTGPAPLARRKLAARSGDFRCCRIERAGLLRLQLQELPGRFRGGCASRLESAYVLGVLVREPLDQIEAVGQLLHVSGTEQELESAAVLPSVHQGSACFKTGLLGVLLCDQFIQLRRAVATFASSVWVSRSRGAVARKRMLQGGLICGDICHRSGRSTCERHKKQAKRGAEHDRA